MHTTLNNDADGVRKQKATLAAVSAKNRMGLMGLDFCCSIQTVGLEFSIASIHPASYQQFRLLVV